MSKKLSHEIIEKALASIEDEVNVTRIANLLNRNISTIWFKVSGNRKWDVENWLLLLNIIGKLRYEKGKLIIECDLPPSWEQKLRENYRRYF